MKEGLKRVTADDLAYLSDIEAVLDDARAGRMFVLIDDEDRENEGDLVIPAEFCDAAAVNFMARYGRGLICLAMTRERCGRLDLPLMAQGNEPRLSTAFTVSIEAREGVTTGISAADRARTIAAAIAPNAKKDDLVRPGHVFPLVARDGGVLVRTGHTEAAVDLARLAGLAPAGVICEIMNDDGSMARLPDLVPFAQLHGLKIGKIADLVEHRLRTERLVEPELERTFESHHGGEFRLCVYLNRIDGVEHLALVKGDLSGPEPVLVRVHAVNMFEDLLGGGGGGRGAQLHAAMRMIAEAGRGVVVVLRESAATTVKDGLAASVARTYDDGPRDLRVYGVGAQILHDLGVKDMIVLSNSGPTIVGLEGYHLRVVETRPIG